MVESKSKTKNGSNETPVFSKSKILQSKPYAHRVDLLGALLENGQSYTFDQVEAVLADFMNHDIKSSLKKDLKGKVK